MGKDNKEHHPSQFFLEQARDAIELASRKASTEQPTAKTLEEIRRLCATAQFEIARAIRDCENQTEARVAATSLLASPTINRTATERTQSNEQ